MTAWGVLTAEGHADVTSIHCSASSLETWITADAVIGRKVRGNVLEKWKTSWTTFLLLYGLIRELCCKLR